MAVEDVGNLCQIIESRFRQKNLDVIVSRTDLAELPGYSLSIRSNILLSLSNFAERSKTSDLRFVYYAGHGVVDSDGELYLVPSDFKEGLCSHTGISLSHVLGSMHGLGGETIVFLDCCRQNSQMEVLPLLKPFSVRMGARTHLLLGCSDGEACHEVADDRLRGGIFTAAMLKALQDCGEEATLREVFEEICREQAQLVSTFVNNRTQTPQLFSLNSRGFPLGRLLSQEMT